MKVPPICTKEKGKIVKGLVRSETFSNPASPWGTISCKYLNYYNLNLLIFNSNTYLT